jgi:hypothetical protein
LHNYNLIKVTEIRENGDFPGCMVAFDIPERFPRRRLGKRTDWNIERIDLENDTQEFLLRDTLDIAGVIHVITGTKGLTVIKSPVFGWKKIFERLRWILSVYDYGFLAYHPLENEPEPEPLLIREDCRETVFHVGTRIGGLNRITYDRDRWYEICQEYGYWQLPGYEFVGKAFNLFGDRECPCIIMDTYELHLVKSIYTETFDPQGIEALRQELSAFLLEKYIPIPFSLELKARAQAICLLNKEIRKLTLDLAAKMSEEKKEKTSRYIPRQ